MQLVIRTVLQYDTTGVTYFCFLQISRTHDQDSDADLWREGSFFGKKITRYICLSKTEGISDFIVESVAVINEKEVPPEGFALITRTADGGE